MEKSETLDTEGTSCDECYPSYTVTLLMLGTVARNRSAVVWQVKDRPTDVLTALRTVVWCGLRRAHYIMACQFLWTLATTLLIGLSLPSSPLPSLLLSLSPFLPPFLPSYIPSSIPLSFPLSLRQGLIHLGSDPEPAIFLPL